MSFFLIKIKLNIFKKFIDNFCRTFVDLVPTVIWNLFVGAFLDKQPNATKWILYLTVVGDIFQISVFLLNEHFFHISMMFILPAWLGNVFSGGLSTFMAVSFRYVSVTSRKKDRATKFMILQFAIVLGTSIGAFAGGNLLFPNNLELPHERIRKYYVVFLTAISIDLLCVPLIMAILNVGSKKEIMIKQEEAEERARERIEDNEKDAKMGRVEHGIEPESQELNLKSNILKQLFDIDNIKETYKTLTKSRPDRINISVFTIFICYFFVFFNYIGVKIISLPFCEKVYKWSPQEYSVVNGIAGLVFGIMVALCAAIFVNKLKIDNSILIAAGSIIAFIGNAFIGKFLIAIVYYLTMPFGKPIFP